MSDAKPTSINDGKKVSFNDDKKKVSINSDNRKGSKTNDKRNSDKGKEPAKAIDTSEAKTGDTRSEDESRSETSSEDFARDRYNDDDENETWRDILWKSFQDFGPPYKEPDEDTPPYALITECADYNCKLWKVNSLLNKRLDPNERDPEDLFYTPMHWCVRNCHLSALKLLHKAGANINILNELGACWRSSKLVYIHSSPTTPHYLIITQGSLHSGWLVYWSFLEISFTIMFGWSNS